MSWCQCTFVHYGLLISQVTFMQVSRDLHEMKLKVQLYLLADQQSDRARDLIFKKGILHINKIPFFFFNGYPDNRAFRVDSGFPEQMLFRQMLGMQTRIVVQILDDFTFCVFICGPILA